MIIKILIYLFFIFFIYRAISRFFMISTNTKSHKRTKSGKKIDFKDADYEEIDWKFFYIIAINLLINLIL